MTATTGAHRPLFLDVLKSEWIKLRTVRSSWWCLVGAVTGLMAFAIIGGAVANSHYAKLDPVEKLSFEPISFSLSGGAIAQMAIAVMGVLFITGEYSSGLIRTTFLAVPQRRLVMVAKSVVLALSTYAVTQVVAFAAFFSGQALLHGTGIAARITDPGALRMVIGTGCYLAVTAVFGMGVGCFIRHTGGAVTMVFWLIFVLPGLLQLVPQGIRDNIYKYLPSTSGQALFSLHGDSSTLAPWVGFAVYTAWALLLLVGAMALLTKRDA